jgi:uncharacterized protein YcfJ
LEYTLNKFFITTSLLALATASGAAGAQTPVQPQDMGRVISSTPVVQQVAVPRQVCSQQQVAVPQQRSGAGAVIGAIAGGAIGNQIGQGGGNAAATLIGLVGGAMLGNSIEGQSASQVQTQQQCTTQTFYENRAVAYNVVYEFGGRQYSTQMAQDPGPYVRLQVTPVGSAPALEAPPQAVYSSPPTIVQSVVTVPPTYVVAEPVYRPYYSPSGVSLNFGYVHHGGHYGSRHPHRGHGHHWR